MSSIIACSFTETMIESAVEYLDFLSSGEYYENYKPGIQKTTGFNFGTSLQGSSWVP